MYAVDEIHSKEGVYPEVLFILTLKAIDVIGPCGHGPTKWLFQAQVIPHHLNKVLCTVIEVLPGGEYVDPLVQ